MLRSPGAHPRRSLARRVGSGPVVEHFGGELSFHQTQAPADGKSNAHAQHCCMSRFRFLVLIVEALPSGAFEWVLFESFDDVPRFEPLARSELSFTTYKSAWDAGCVALQSRMEDPKLELLDNED
jgi:hypothetical protein